MAESNGRKIDIEYDSKGVRLFFDLKGYRMFSTHVLYYVMEGVDGLRPEYTRGDWGWGVVNLDIDKVNQCRNEAGELPAFSSLSRLILYFKENNSIGKDHETVDGPYIVRFEID